MEWREQDPVNCSIGRSVAVIGQPWVMLILRDCFGGLKRFGELQAHLGVSRSVLAERLDLLVREGLLVRQSYQEAGSRPRDEYLLTEKGRALYPAITALREWGDRYLADEQGPATIVEHANCGARVHTVLVCEDGHVVGSSDDVIRLSGPGARVRTAAA